MNIIKLAFMIGIVVVSRLTAYQFKPADGIALWAALLILIFGYFAYDEIEK